MSPTCTYIGHYLSHPVYSATSQVHNPLYTTFALYITKKILLIRMKVEIINLIYSNKQKAHTNKPCYSLRLCFACSCRRLLFLLRIYDIINRLRLRLIVSSSNGDIICLMRTSTRMSSIVRTSFHIQNSGISSRLPLILSMFIWILGSQRNGNLYVTFRLLLIGKNHR